MQNKRTLLANQAIIPVIRVVRIPQTSLRVLKLQEFMPVFARMTRAEEEKFGRRWSASVETNSERNTENLLVS